MSESGIPTTTKARGVAIGRLSRDSRKDETTVKLQNYVSYIGLSYVLEAYGESKL